MVSNLRSQTSNLKSQNSNLRYQISLALAIAAWPMRAPGSRALVRGWPMRPCDCACGRLANAAFEHPSTSHRNTFPHPIGTHSHIPHCNMSPRVLGIPVCELLSPAQPTRATHLAAYRSPIQIHPLTQIHPTHPFIQT